MIKFFRKIRQNLIQENKMGKYFKYAIGEIILVVIGILIALQVSNWNEQRKLDSRIDKLLPKLKNQIQNNIERTHEDLEGVKYYFKRSRIIANTIFEKDKAPKPKKLDSLILFTGTDFHLNLNMIILNESQINEDLALIKSDSLREALYTLIKVNEDLIERERIINDDLKTNLKPFLNKNYNLKNLFNSLGSFDISKSKIYNDDNYKITLNQEFENLVTTRILYLDDLVYYYSEIKEVLETVNQLLEKEILVDK